MFFYSFNYLKNFLKTGFVLCDTNGVVAKLYTSLCSFKNNLKAIDYLFNLIIREDLSPIQFEAGVCRKLCDNCKILKNMVYADLFKSNIWVFRGGTSLKSGGGGSPMRLETSAFSNWRKRCHTLSFSSSRIIGENNPPGMISSCRYQLCQLSSNFGVILSKKRFSTDFWIFLEEKFLSPNYDG